MQTYHGNCHCGVVTFDVELDLGGTIIDCNCSHCAMKGLLLAFVTAPAFTLVTGADALTEYRFGKGSITHLFCTSCGVQPIGRGTNKKGEPMMAINVRCLQGVDITTLARTPFDGKSL